MSASPTARSAQKTRDAIKDVERRHRPRAARPPGRQGAGGASSWSVSVTDPAHLSRRPRPSPAGGYAGNDAGIKPSPAPADPEGPRASRPLPISRADLRARLTHPNANEALMATHKLLLLPGDGIGPEVMREVEKLVAWFRKRGIALRDRDRPRRRRGLRRPRQAVDQRRRHGARQGRRRGAVRRGRRAEMGRRALCGRAPRRASCACARISACSPTCARRSATRPSPTPPP